MNTMAWRCPLLSLIRGRRYVNHKNSFAPRMKWTLGKSCEQCQFFNRRWMSSSSTPSPTTSKVAELDINIPYSQEQMMKIIDVINDLQTPEDYDKYRISKRAMKDLMDRKQNNKKIEEWNELVKIIGDRTCLRVFYTILDRPIPSMRNPIVPYPTEEQVENVSKVVSVVMRANRISWCNIQRHKDGKQFIIQNMQHEILDLKMKIHFLSLLNEMVTLANKIPPCELCIVEEYGSSPPTAQLFPYYLQMTHMRSKFLGYLSCRPEGPKIAAIKSSAVARIFNINVGQERVSGQHLVDDMITWKPLPSLIASSGLKYAYENAKPEIKEGLSSAFLLNLAYWKLTKQFTDSYS